MLQAVGPRSRDGGSPCAHAKSPGILAGRDPALLIRSFSLSLSLSVSLLMSWNQICLSLFEEQNEERSLGESCVRRGD